MPKAKIILAIVLILVVAAVAFVAVGQSGPGKYDSFAQCLSSSGVKMYGAYWCPHCNNQKQLFGSSWKYMDYVECSLPNRAGQTAVCREAGIEAYPTWALPDGSKMTGELSLQRLAQQSGCELPAATG